MSTTRNVSTKAIAIWSVALVASGAKRDGPSNSATSHIVIRSAAPPAMRYPWGIRLISLRRANGDRCPESLIVTRASAAIAHRRRRLPTMRPICRFDTATQLHGDVMRNRAAPDRGVAWHLRWERRRFVTRGIAGQQRSEEH